MGHLMYMIAFAALRIYDEVEGVVLDGRWGLQPNIEFSFSTASLE